MAIYMLDGIPGSGKSYSCLKDFIIPAVKADREIYCNIDGIDVEAICRYLKKDYDDYVGKFHYMDELAEEGFYMDKISKSEHNALIIVDEAHKFYGSRSFSKFTVELQHYFAYHRHFGHDIILISQTVDSIDKWIRTRTQQIICYRKLTVFGMDSTYTATVKDPFTDAVLSRTTNKFKPEYFKLYTSYVAGAALDSFQEQKVWLTPMKSILMIGFAAIVLISVAGYFFYTGFFGMKLDPTAGMSKTHIDKLNKVSGVVTSGVVTSGVITSGISSGVVKSGISSGVVKSGREYGVSVSRGFLKVTGYSVRKGNIVLLMVDPRDPFVVYRHYELGLNVKYYGGGRYCFVGYKDQCYKGSGFLYLPTNTPLYEYLTHLTNVKVLDSSKPRDRALANQYDNDGKIMSSK